MEEICIGHGTIDMDGRTYDFPKDQEKYLLEILMSRSTYLNISVARFKKHAKYDPEKDEIYFKDFDCALAYRSLIDDAKVLTRIYALMTKNVPKMLAILEALNGIGEKERAKARK